MLQNILHNSKKWYNSYYYNKLNHKQGAEKVRETKELIKIFNKLSEENKKKFMVVLNLLAKEETSRTAQAVSSSLQTENR